MRRKGERNDRKDNKELTFRAVWSGKKSGLVLALQMLVPHLEQKEWAMWPWLKV
jgi:hypothetical protein